MRSIDHLVLPVTTLMLARTRVTNLGFTVAPDAQHPFGTGNCCVFFRDRTFLEPITIVDRAATDMAAAEGVVFVKRMKRFTERQGEGFAMVALKSDDAEADQAAFAATEMDAGPVFRFSRLARLPDGTEREVGFAIANVEFPAAGDAGFFVCQHLAKDALFPPILIEHPNGVVGTMAVAAVAENPADFHILLEAVMGQRELRVTSFGVEAQIGGGATFLILTPEGFHARYGLDAPNPRRGLRFAAVDLRVLDIERAARCAGRAAKRWDGLIVVPPAPGLHAVIAFRSEEDGASE
jgi:Glyoxalase-like domain